MNKKEETAFKKFIIKYTVIASVFSWLLSVQFRELLDALVDNISEPLFSMDINQDGKPDIEQANKLIYSILGFKFPVGKVLLAIIKTILALVLIYVAIQILYLYTDYLRV